MGIITDLLGDGLNIAGIISNNNAVKKQQRTNEEQLSTQNMIQQAMLGLAKKQQAMSTAGQVDGYGDVSYYDPSTNTYRTKLSPEGQQLQDVNTREQMQTGQAATDQFAQMRGNAVRRAQEGQVADTTMRQYQDQQAGRDQTGSVDSIAAQNRMSRRTAINDGLEPVRSTAMSDAIRSGSGDVSGLIKALSQARTQATGGIWGNPEGDAQATAQQMQETKANGFVNRYNTMAARASNVDNTSFAPSNTPSSATDVLTAIRNGALQGNSSAGNIQANAAAGGVNATSKLNTLNNADAQLFQQMGAAVPKVSNDLGKLFASFGG